jgi:hypothetical protein
MTRAVLILATSLMIQACSQVPSSGDCHALLQSNSPDIEVAKAFIAKSEQILSNAPANGSNPELEVLGLCVGALKRNTGL